MKPQQRFGERRICYNNFAGHLLNAYNPNVLHPGLPHRWSDGDWSRMLDMIAGFGFNVFEFWLPPRLFCREGLASECGREFVRQMNVVIDHAATLSMRVEMLVCLTTVGADWHTHCPNVKREWDEVLCLWDEWTRQLPALGIVSIFPGDPGGCSLNGCNAETYINKSAEVAEIIRKNLPKSEIEFGTWGPPFFGWGNINGPAGWRGEFIQEYQHTGWDFDRKRADRALRHLLKRLPDFPDETSVAINLGFNADGNPGGEDDARAWAREIAKTHRILTWGFSLTEGENAIYPHYRFDRLFARRREERAAAPYSGGICMTITPLLNQLSMYEASQSFRNPDADPRTVAEDFFEKLFGADGRTLAEYMPYFEVVPDWGHYMQMDLSRHAYHDKMKEMAALIEALEAREREDFPFHPSVEAYRQELLFFARLFVDLSGLSPDYDALRTRYWKRVYSVYDQLPEHVDARPKKATDNLVRRFETLGS